MGNSVSDRCNHDTNSFMPCVFLHNVISNGVSRGIDIASGQCTHLDLDKGTSCPSVTYCMSQTGTRNWVKMTPEDFFGLAALSPYQSQISSKFECAHEASESIGETIFHDISITIEHFGIDLSVGSCSHLEIGKDTICPYMVYRMKKIGTDKWIKITPEEFSNIMSFPDGFKWIEDKYFP